MPKPGWKSTEFWTTTIATLGGLLAMFGVHMGAGDAATVQTTAAAAAAATQLAPPSTAIRIVGGILAGASQAAYALSRGKVKSSSTSSGPTS